MAANFPTILVVIFLLQNASSYRIYSKQPEAEMDVVNERSHLKFPRINKICMSRDEICKSNDSHVCTVRVFNKNMEYKDFENACFLFLSNMCDYPGDEYHIIDSIRCESYLRRKNQRRQAKNTSAVNLTNTTSAGNATNTRTTGNFTVTMNSTESVIRSASVSPLYDLDTAFDYHVCPLSCPETYSPVCVSANRGTGKYFKFYTFVNHCQGDVYYCKHFDEFGPPPDTPEEDVNSSGLSWSYCGAFRYMQFARFSEVLSSMGHYGWLSGDQRYSRILKA